MKRGRNGENETAMTFFQYKYFPNRYNFLYENGNLFQKTALEYHKMLNSEDHINQS